MKPTNAASAPEIDDPEEVKTEQLALFEVEAEMARLAEHKKLIVLSQQAQNTRRAYGSDWRDFAEWCRKAGLAALPATDDTVALYLTDLSRKAKPATLERRRTAITKQHVDAKYPSPIGEQVRAVLRGARRQNKKKSGAKAALTVPELLRMVRAVKERREPWASRDSAMLLVGFASGMRRSELVGLDLADVELHGKERVALHLGRSKTDQEGRGRTIGLFAAKRAELCPVRAMRAWLKQRGPTEGPLFVPMRPRGEQGPILDRRLVDDVVYKLVRWAAEAAGLDPARFGAHSLRAGMVTAALNAGHSELAVMSRTGHKSVVVLERYYRRRSAFAVDPLKGVL